MSLTVDHLRTRLCSSRAIAPARREAWHQAFAAQDGEALAAGLVGADEWLLIRRLTLATAWRADAAAAEVGQAWGQALRQAIEAAMAPGAGDEAGSVLFYASRRAAIADLFYRSALGQTARQWAWQRMGLLPREGLAATAALAEGVALLVREPPLIWPVLQRLVAAESATAALTACLRALPASAWARLLAICPQTMGHWQALAAAEPPPRDQGLQREMLQEQLDRQDLGFDRPAAQALLAWAGARAWFVSARFDTVAVLLAAQAQPGARGAGACCSLACALALMRAALPKTAPPRLAGPRDASTGGPAPRQDATPTTLPEAPALPEVSQWQTTRWAGTLFWLTRATALDEDELPLLLRELTLALGVPGDDPVLAAFCGGLVPGAEAEPPLAARAQACVRQWRDWLDEAAPDLPAPRLTAVCQRAGRLRVEPGWIELHLPLSGLDTAIRRLGLDLDPGWLPGLGCVVRFVYDDE